MTRPVTLTAKRQSRLVVTSARTPPATRPGEPGEPGEARAPRAAAGTGYIAIQSPIVLRIVRNGDFVGTSEDTRLSLPVGHQIIGLENESVGFRDVRTVEVVAGKVTPVEVTLPKGEISINARPWAEVFVDGNRVGETPVSQLSLPVGIHEILFRHPEHGERRVAVVVKIGRHRPRVHRLHEVGRRAASGRRTPAARHRPRSPGRSRTRSRRRATSIRLPTTARRWRC